MMTIENTITINGTVDPLYMPTYPISSINPPREKRRDRISSKIFFRLLFTTFLLYGDHRKYHDYQWDSRPFKYAHLSDFVP